MEKRNGRECQQKALKQVAVDKKNIETIQQFNSKEMNFDLNKSIEILERTPEVLSNLLGGLSDHWVMTNEGG